ncbi:MAG: hypothetical protein ABSD98_05270 [Candidatus Korobacteraceae bacterium]|jgi:hypothetical protein
MTLTSLFLLSMIMSAGVATAAEPAQSAGPSPMVATVENLPPLEESSAPPQSFQLTPAEPRADNALSPSDDICYKIRAYIFKRDDDHAPEFVRSTTCGPGRPRAKGAAWPKARLVPAD